MLGLPRLERGPACRCVAMLHKAGGSLGARRHHVLWLWVVQHTRLLGSCWLMLCLLLGLHCYRAAKAGWQRPLWQRGLVQGLLRGMLCLLWWKRHVHALLRLVLLGYLRLLQYVRWQCMRLLQPRSGCSRKAALCRWLPLVRSPLTHMARCACCLGHAVRWWHQHALVQQLLQLLS